jgi:molybdopterin molybdotransferase
MALLPVADALARLLDPVSRLASERVPLHEAAGRVLAGPLRALRTQPPFDASAMDGYALRAEDATTVPRRLSLIGVAAAGHRFAGAVGEGQAVRILTGAPLPDGADSIVIQENTAPAGDGAIEVLEAPIAGRHIRRRALDFAEGDALLDDGRYLDAAALSLAASANHATLDVVRRPIVAIVATGDELVEPGGTPGPDQIIASNSFGVAAIASSVGANVVDLGIVPDRHDEIAACLTRADQLGADIVVTLGGASVGDHDLVQAALLAHGVELDFWKIAMRPGKPLMVGRRGNTTFIGMPGNPVASIVCSHLFLKPLIARLSGTALRHDIREAVLGAPMAANDLREDYVRAGIVLKGDSLTATPFPVQDSSMLRTLAESGALIIRPPFAAAAEAGEVCRILILRP